MHVPWNWANQIMLYMYSKVIVQGNVKKSVQLCLSSILAVIVDIISTGESEKENYMEATATVGRVLKKGILLNYYLRTAIYFRAGAPWPGGSGVSLLNYSPLSAVVRVRIP